MENSNTKRISKKQCGILLITAITGLFAFFCYRSVGKKMNFRSYKNDNM